MVLFSRPQQWLYLEGTCHQLGHTWNPSCIYSSIDLFVCVFWEGFKLYLPLYLVSDIVGRSSLKSVLLKTLPNVLRSSVFLGTNGGLFVTFICLIRRLLGRFYFYSTAFLPAFLASLGAISIERKSRRRLLMGYVSTIAVEFIYTLLKSKGYVSALPYGEVLLFSAASAVLFHKQRTQNVDDAIGLLLRRLLNPWIPSAVNRSFKSCIVDNRVTTALLTGLWGFLLGYLSQTLISVVSRGKKLFTEKGQPLKTLLDSHNLRFAMFLATLTSGFKLANSILYHSPLPRDARLALAGVAAGLSMCFLRSTTLSLYAAGKALEVLYFKGVEHGWLKSWYYGDALLFAVSTATLFHAAFFEGHNLRLGYWYFLKKISRSRLTWINFDVLDFFGTEASKRPKQIMQEREHSEH